MTLQERLKVLQNLLDSKARELANLDIVRQNRMNELIELRGKVKLLNEMVKEEEDSKSKEKDEESNVKEEDKESKQE